MPSPNPIGAQTAPSSMSRKGNICNILVSSFQNMCVPIFAYLAQFIDTHMYALPKRKKHVV